MKNNILIVILLALVCLLLGFVNGYYYFTKGRKLLELPIPEDAKGERGDLGIDNNINENVIDNYLGRKDSVYLDMRLLEGNNETDTHVTNLSGFIKGFTVIPYQIIVKTKESSYNGDTLFSEVDGEYQPNYEESYDILNYYFPKNKYIFLMSENGKYAGLMKKLLISLGWNKNLIYNIGGYSNYQGKNKIEIKRTTADNIKYDIWKVPYNNIDFSILNKKNL